ncbi:hypothetical protein [Methylobrevis pamukkalensis]|uniref:Uncharacterized protein n=1 Tax=Methylobrevis pamukkalensis TaxID=1439726 RepID=A0A1E3GXC5_9HYPH|nr:hypothetical protein [Methylobrevis pamukkalensis]ODN68729.1 hypothetical protein A6302_03961 [Methylobrevis pamukkalensis]
MTIKSIALATAVLAGITGAAVAAPYHPGYSTSDIELRNREARAANSQVVGTHGSSYAAPEAAVTGSYHPGYSDSDLRLRERASSHTQPWSAAAGYTDAEKAQASYYKPGYN